MAKVRGAARIAVLVGAAALLYGMAGCGSKTSQASVGGELAQLRTGDMQRMVIPGQANPDVLVKENVAEAGTAPAAAPAPDLTFTGPDGKDVKLADFKGKVLVVNFWATWCADCKVELPSLGRLATAYAGKPVAVVAVSVDKADAIPAAKDELAKAPPLALYNDAGMKLPFAMSPTIGFFPTTIIYDKNGVEQARLIGAAAWDGAQAGKVIDAVLRVRQHAG